ncbi:MAG: hypothetical protein KDC28_10935 [Saprospiraceae bacterium]|nr:hypothetical protein [Saprospiraceae bacterium]
MARTPKDEEAIHLPRREPFKATTTQLSLRGARKVTKQSVCHSLTLLTTSVALLSASAALRVTSVALCVTSRPNHPKG